MHGQQQAFADYLMRIGEGSDGECLRVPDDLLLKSTDPVDLIRHIFGDLANDPAARQKDRLMERAILVPLNKDV